MKEQYGAQGEERGYNLNEHVGWGRPFWGSDLRAKGGRRELGAEGGRNAVSTWASDISGEPLFREIFMATLVWN